ncbi:hypothetical protein ACFLX5_03360 [Chloroflexota bacterium]
MIVSPDSPLKNLPSGMPRKQILFLDAIRYSIEMAALAYSRLCSTLLEITITYGNAELDRSSSFISSFQDAWATVDSVYRLRTLLQRAPKFKQNMPGLQLFYRHTEVIDDLRNSIQHLGTEIEAILDKDIPALGILRWFALSDPERRSGLSCIMLSGSIFSGQHDMVNPLGRTIDLPVELVTLTVSEYTVCLSDIMKDVLRLTNGIERSLEGQVLGMPLAGADVLICMEIASDIGPNGATSDSSE